MFIIRPEKAFCFSHLVWGAKNSLVPLILSLVARDKKSSLGRFLAPPNGGTKNTPFQPSIWNIYFLFQRGKKGLFPPIELSPNKLAFLPLSHEKSLFGSQSKTRTFRIIRRSDFNPRFIFIWLYSQYYMDKYHFLNWQHVIESGNIGGVSLLWIIIISSTQSVNNLWLTWIVNLKSLIYDQDFVDSVMQRQSLDLISLVCVSFILAFVKQTTPWFNVK